MTTEDDESRIRRRLRVRGVVQGVGFRPFVYTLALRLQLAGFVGNDGGGVFIEVEGSATAVEQFCSLLAEQPPPLAHIDAIEVTPAAVTGVAGFAIEASAPDTTQRTLVSPDLCLCDACRQELFDPHNRRYLYPFINCTDCGPRFTITRETPYDRPVTTMAGFALCPDCAREYADPTDRRFHAQPNACPVCGPQVRLECWHLAPAMAGGWPAVQGTHDALLAAQELLAAGKVLAVKGIGGFHLACDATDDGVVGLLRIRKGRVDKPFAVMAANLAVVRSIAYLDAGEEALLTSRARPIVLLRKRAGSALASLVAPGNGHVGVMLPYTPLHELLYCASAVAAVAPRPSPLLVLTSGNRSDEPIVYRDEEAWPRLGTLADGCLTHDRPIHVPCDDAVVRSYAGGVLPLRRARGYAPMPVKLPFAVPPLLAVGGELKSTFCLAAGREAFLSQHIGDMGNLETLDAFAHAVDHFRALFRIEPQIVVCDAHPGYLSSRWAAQWVGARRLMRVQHHHAHVAGLMAEHALPRDASVLGICFDGTGYGDDGAIWGGELLLGGYQGYRRLAHLRYVPLPGGDAAIRRPYRTALAHLWAAGLPWQEALPPVAACPPGERAVLRQQLVNGFNCVPTSSMGRLFDAVAALAGVRQQVTYEAQAAIELEALVDRGIACDSPYQLAIIAEGATLQIDSSHLLAAICSDVTSGVSPRQIATGFHHAVADLVVNLSLAVRRNHAVELVGLSGGVFQNIVLLDLAEQKLRAAGFTVLVHRLVPPNDGGLALGQAVVAAAQMEE